MIDFVLNAFADFYLLVNADGTFKFCFELIILAFFVALATTNCYNEKKEG